MRQKVGKMNKYLEPPKVTFEKKKLEIPVLLDSDMSNIVKDIAQRIAKQRDDTIEKILLDMGITRDFMIAHKEDFMITDTGTVKVFSYKDKVLFTETVCMDDTNCVYKYKIYQNERVV